MADLNALIAQGVQFDMPNPVDQYSKVMQLQAAQQQMQLNRQQAQQIQEDRAGFATLREKLADKNLTPEQYELALINSPSKDHQKMGFELRSRRNLLAEYDKAQKEGGIGAEPPMAPAAMPAEAPMAAPVAQTFDTSAAMVAPVQKPYSAMSYEEKILYDEWTGRGRQRQPQSATAAYTVNGQPVPFGDYVNANIANSAGAGERAAMAAMPNALAARVAPAEPVANAMLAQPPAAASVGNAMASKQAQIAEINKRLKIATSPKFAEVPNIDKEIARLESQLKQLTESPLAKIDPKDYDPDSFAAYMQTGDATKLRKITDQRLAFDQAKFEWEKANPNKTLKEVAQGGVTKYFSVDDRSGVATPVTIAGGKILTGTDMASQRLAFDQAKFAWEKANPGFTIQQTEDGSIVGVNNRTLNAYPVTLNAGGPPSAAPFTGIGGAAPSAGVGRGAVGVTDSRLTPTAPAVAPAVAPLKGKTAGLTESQGNATAFGMRMKQSHDLLTGLEKSGATDTGIARGVIGGTLGLTPLIGDKLNDATGNIFNALHTVLGGLNEQQQQTVNARINFITALLRKESGAAIGPSEFSTAEKLYFPKPGDPKSVIEQKQRARELAIQAMKIQAGPGAKNIGAAQGEGSTDESDPLGIRK
jgi:hypothetical protein